MTHKFTFDKTVAVELQPFSPLNYATTEGNERYELRDIPREVLNAMLAEMVAATLAKAGW